MTEFERKKSDRKAIRRGEEVFELKKKMIIDRNFKS
jgi:hypothetical protein